MADKYLALIAALFPERLTCSQRVSISSGSLRSEPGTIGLRSSSFAGISSKVASPNGGRNAMEPDGSPSGIF